MSDIRDRLKSGLRGLYPRFPSGHFHSPEPVVVNNWLSGGKEGKKHGACQASRVLEPVLPHLEILPSPVKMNHLAPASVAGTDATLCSIGPITAPLLPDSEMVPEG